MLVNSNLHVVVEHSWVYFCAKSWGSRSNGLGARAKVVSQKWGVWTSLCATQCLGYNARRNWSEKLIFCVEMVSECVKLISEAGLSMWSGWSAIPSADSYKCAPFTIRFFPFEFAMPFPILFKLYTELHWHMTKNFSKFRKNPTRRLGVIA